MADVQDNKKLYVGNLAWSVNNESLKAAFAECGNVVEAAVAIDRLTGRSRGFAFVTFDTEEAAQAAIARWNDQDLEGRPLRVNVAQPREEGAARRPSYNGGGASRGGYGGGAPRSGGYNSRNTW